MTTLNQTSLRAADQKLIDGLVKHAGDIPSLVLGTQTLQNADIVSRIEQLITLAKASAAARVAFQESAAASKAARRAQRPVLNDLRQTLRARFSSSPTILADFGLSAHVRAKPTAKTLVASAEKAKATRVARGTKGSKVLSEVQGDVTGVVVTPVKAGPPVIESTPVPAATPKA